MAEVLLRFAEPLTTTDGARYVAQACAAPNDQGLWEGWIEFLPLTGDPPLRSPRETTQPNRADAAYWATGLTSVYLEGALDRALNPLERKPAPSPKAIFDGPAPVSSTAESAPLQHDAVLDPFSVYEKGEVILRQELGALSSWHLVNIILAYDLSAEPVSVLNEMSASTLIELIVSRVRADALVR